MPAVDESYGYPLFRLAPWTFTGPANLLVLDLFLSGDRYEVFDNSISLGMTSAPGPELQCGDPLIADIGCSLATANFSRGLYALGAGTHSITINYLVTTSVQHSGVALQLTAATETPEPATIALAPLGFAAVLLLKRRVG